MPGKYANSDNAQNIPVSRGKYAPQKINRVTSFLTGASQGLSFNTSDETAGKIARQKWENKQQGKAIKELFSGKPQNALRRMEFVYGEKGQPYKQAITKQAREEARTFIKNAQDSNPVSFMGGAITGALVPIGVAKVGKAPQAVKLGTRVGRGIVEGAVQGGLYGAGDATEGNRLSGAGQGAFVGGLLGGAIPIAGKVGSKVGNRIKANLPLPKQAPVNKATSLIVKATKNKPNETIGAMTALKNAGVPNPTLADVNPKLARQVGSFARVDKGGAARELAANRGTDMLNQVPSAASKMIRKQTNVPQTKAQIEEMLTAAKNRKQGALINPIRNNQYQLTPIQQAVMASPNVRNATASTANILDTLAASQGTPSQDVNVLRGIVRGEPNNNMVSLDAMEQLRRRLGDQVNNAYQSGNKSLGRDLGTVQDALIQPVREAFPAYNQALNVGNIAKSQIEAMDTGAKDIFNAQTPDIIDTLGNMTNREQRGFRQGAANQMVNRLMDDRNNFDLLRRMAAGQDFTNKLGVTFGQDAAQGLQEGAQALNQRVAAARAVNPNFGSQTAENLANDTPNIANLMGGWKLKAVDYAQKFLTNATPEERYQFIDMVTRPYSPDELNSIFTAHQNELRQGLAPQWVTYLFQNQGAQMGGRQGQ